MSAQETNLPRWNIDDLIDPALGDARTEDNFWQPNFAPLQTRITEFVDTFRGTLSDSLGDHIAHAIGEYQNIYEDISRVGSYARLLHAENMEDPRRGAHYQQLMEQLIALDQELVFFKLELNSITTEHLERALSDSEALQNFEPCLRDLRATKPYELPEREEQLFAQKSLTSSAAWIRLFDETTAAMRFRIRDKDYTQSETLKFLTEPDRALRQDAATALCSELQKHQPTFVRITNVLAKDKSIEDDWRGFAQPISSRNLDNLIEDEVVEALRSSVKAAYPRLSHRYFQLKAKLLGLEKLEFWDRSAPLPQSTETQVSWQDAQKLVLDAYHHFSPEIGEIAERFFRQGWIDAEPSAGKAGGAFAHPTVPSAHPYILLNYQGKGRDVMTLAHELGHGVHQVLAAQQGYLKSQTPLTLAETASVFGEMLSFEVLLERCVGSDQKTVLLADKIEDMLNTVVRQISFLDFEIQVHDARRKGEIPAEKLCEIWQNISEESLGPAFNLKPEFGIIWGYVPHFIHSPFYVYAYAFGDCLVNALYQIYKNSDEKFVERYIALLSAGGSQRYDTLLAPFGLDAKDPAFWNIGLDMIEGFIDQLEESVNAGTPGQA